MAAGFFGKLPSKRDFVASGASRPFLDLWEPWLQASLATSRQTLGEDWPNAYNRMPIWRFWLGAQFAGEAIVGALMASVDGVGRPFPLAIRAARRFGHRSAFAGQSFWWTVGGDGFEALALAVVGMPAPLLFADMLTGAFGRADVHG